MPTRPKGRCTYPSCPNDQQADNRRCPTHARQAEQERGSAADRGYLGKGHKRFRQTVLKRDPICKCDRPDHAWHAPTRCLHISHVADHFPLSRKELVAQGLDPNDARHGRGLCDRCHNSETAANQPGGWNK